MALYEPDGTERVVVEESKITCGKAIATTYFHPTTGELLRRDTRIEVDAAALGMIGKAGTVFGSK